MFALSSFKIGFRLLAGFGLVLSLLCLMAAAAAWQMNGLAANTNYYATNIVPSLQQLHEIALDLTTIRRHEYRHLTSSTMQGKDESERIIRDVQEGVEKKLNRYEREATSNEADRQALGEVRKEVAGYFAEWDKVRSISRQTVSDPSKLAEAVSLVQGESSKAYARAHDDITKWWGVNEAIATQQHIDSDATHQRANLTLIVLVVAALGFGVAAAVFITRSITTPIQKAVRLAETVAEGDLTAQIEVSGKDEAAQLLQALKHMNERLVEVVSKVRQSSDSIATGSTQIAAGTVDLSQRTEEQASNLEETAASMEQLTSTVRTNAETAHQASELASSAAKAATAGGAVVQQVIATMDGISQSSKKIADIIGVIDGIAFQTNILALNAAVEAARAGEQGRGFAVVASEVRALAQRSAEAAKEIKQLINDSVEKVDAGSAQVNQAGRSMDEIVTQVERVNRLIGDISSATAEQSSGINQVGDAVNQLDQVTQQNAALVEESAAAADSLKHQAAQLIEAVSVFKLTSMRAGATALSAAAQVLSDKASTVSSSIHRLAHASAPERKAKPARLAAAAAPARLAAKDGDGEWATF